MIPVRIALKNFLTYATADGGQPIVFDFDGSSLWSVAGDNGAGKSALFDAITWTLFDQHRGGGQRDDRLVRHGAPGCYASFEFRVDQHMFRVERSLVLRGTKPKTWQASFFNPSVNDWQVIPDTGSEAGFKRWVQDKLGLKYGTFIASTLLLQGQSDRLLLARPKDRFDILAGLLDLMRYQDLARRAHEYAATASGEVKGLDARLLGIPAIDDETLMGAQREALERVTDFTEAQQRVERAAVAVTQARHHGELARKLGEARTQLARAAASIASAATIRAEHDEHKMLVAAIPKLQAALRNIDTADGEDAEAATAERDRDAIGLAALETQASDARDAERCSEQKRSDAQRQLTECNDARLEVQRQLAQVERCEELEQSAAAERVKIDALNADLAARDEIDQRLDLLETRREAQALADGLFTAQADLVDREREVTVIGTLEHWSNLLGARESELAVAQEAKDAAETDRTSAQDTFARAEAQVTIAREALAARTAAKDEAVCSRCGQRVDAEHIAKELAAAKHALAEATSAEISATTRAHDAEAGCAKAARRVNELTRSRDEARAERDRAKTAEGEVSKARTKVQKAERAIAVAASAVSLAATALAQLSTKARETALRDLDQLGALRKRVSELHKKEALLEDARRRLAEIKLECAPIQAQLPPEERERRRARQAQLEKERERLASVSATTQRDLATATHERERADELLTQAKADKSELSAKVERHRERARSERSLAVLNLGDVPEIWRERAQKRDRTLVSELTKRRGALVNTDKRHAELVEAEQSHGRLSSTVTTLVEEMERVPAEYRISTEAAERKHQEAVTARTAREKECDTAKKRVHDLERQREQRAEFDRQLAGARRRAYLYGKLEDLLGRRRLQAYLIDEALRGIEAFANETLARISDHQLVLHLRRESTASGDEEIVIRATDHSASEIPLDIEFISGGQKFRTAVALAAGIGQYAGGLGEAPRALIVDEGFGSLDVRGRQEMIRELHSIAQYLERVIVVSHHDDFRDAVLFPSRYVISRNGEGTTVERWV